MHSLHNPCRRRHWRPPNRHQTRCSTHRSNRRQTPYSNCQHRVGGRRPLTRLRPTRPGRNPLCACPRLRRQRKRTLRSRSPVHCTPDSSNSRLVPRTRPIRPACMLRAPVWNLRTRLRRRARRPKQCERSSSCTQMLFARSQPSQSSARGQPKLKIELDAPELSEPASSPSSRGWI
jgi:hypothetical protein